MTNELDKELVRDIVEQKKTIALFEKILNRWYFDDEIRKVGEQCLNQELEYLEVLERLLSVFRNSSRLRQQWDELSPKSKVDVESQNLKQVWKF